MTAYRKVPDGDGRVWEVWESRPSIIDRRAYQDRRSSFRHGSERRHREEERVPVPPAFRNGWLCFQHGNDWRRVAPIPVGWSSLPDTELVELMRAASGAALR